MRFVSQVPLCLMLSCLPVAAQEVSSPAAQELLDQQLDMGRGVLCDTPQQLARFVALRENGHEAHAALQTVNEEVHNRSACNMAMVMFNGRKELGELTIHGVIVTVVEINVRAFGDGTAWKRVPATPQYTLVFQNGQDI